MKRKFALIAAAATAFSVIVLASVVYGYRVSAAEQAAPAAVVEPQQVEDPVEAVPVSVRQVSPQEAAAAASAYLDGMDPFSVEMANYYGVQAYKVTFPDGAIVYMSTAGKLLDYVPAPVPTQVTEYTSTVPDYHSRRDDRGGGGGEHSDEHESEHESEGDD